MIYFILVLQIRVGFSAQFAREEILEWNVFFCMCFEQPFAGIAPAEVCVASSVNCIWSTDEDCSGSIRDSRFFAIPPYLEIDRVEMPTVFQKERNLHPGLYNPIRNKECSDLWREFSFCLHYFSVLISAIPLAPGCRASEPVVESTSCTVNFSVLSYGININHAGKAF